MDLFYTRHNKDFPAKGMSVEKINYYDLTIVKSGTLEYIINKKSLVATAGSTIFLPPGTYRSRAINPENVDFISFNFRADETINLPFIMADTITPDIDLLIAACDTIQNPTISPQNEVFTSIVSAILVSLQNNFKMHNLSLLVYNLLLFLQSHYKENPSLDEISKHFGYSKTYILRLFKREVGTSIIEYMLNFKLTKATALIIENNLTMSQISEKLGYIDHSFFSRQFKKKFGCTPVEYRKKNYL